MKKYYPILIAKKGEFKALENLNSTTKKEVSPIIELLDDTIDSVEKFAIDQWSFPGNHILFDLTYCGLNARRIERLFRNVAAKKVAFVPVVQHNSTPDYLRIVKLLASELKCNVCFRICNNSGGFVNAKDQVTDLLRELGISSKQVLLLLDFGYVEAHNYNLYPSTAQTAIKSLPFTDFIDVIIAGGSFPKDLTDVKPSGRRHDLPRHEWKMYNNALKAAELKTLKYADYGTKYPIYEVAKYGGTCSLKYTGENDFIIYKGELSDNHADGHGQYITHSQKLIKTPEYPGKTFSWGDDKVDFYAGQSLRDPKRKTGNSTTWVEISQNHHISLIVSLL